MKTRFLCAALLILVFVPACGGSSPPADGLPAEDTALCAVLGVDYANNVGLLSAIGLPSLTVVENVAPQAISGDPVVRAFDGKLYVVNRLASNLTVIDPDGWVVERQVSTGAGANPQDVAVVGTKAYVVAAGKPELQEWDLATEGVTAPTRTIDLSTHDEDGNPDAGSVVVVGDRAYVVVSVLDWSSAFPVPRGKGKVLVVDLAAGTVVETVELEHTNPTGLAVPHGDDILIPTSGDFSGTTGCLERVSVTGDPASRGCLVTNVDLGNATISGVAPGAAGDLFLAVSRYDEQFNRTATLRRVDPAGALVPGSLAPATQTPGDVAFAAETGAVVYADAEAGGVRVLDVATQTERTTSAIDVGLPPAFSNGIVCSSR